MDTDQEPHETGTGCQCGCRGVLRSDFDWKKQDPNGEKLELFKKHNPQHNPIGWYAGIKWWH